MRVRRAVVMLPMLLAACEVGPDYVRPEPASPTPAAFKEVPDGWKVAQPNDAMKRGSWWSVYNDPVLDALERQVVVNNQTVKASEAAFRQASAIIREARAELLPVINASSSVTRSQQGSGSTANGALVGGAGQAHTRYSVLGTVSNWEIDLWGQIRRQIESDVATAQATAGDLASAQLSAQAQLATAYFELRVDDELRRLLEATVEAYTRSLQITKNKYAAGTAARSDVAQAQTQLDTTRAQLIAVGVTRAQFEHAIAVLIGKAPADFSIAPVVLNTQVPVIPPDMPSVLLERRPDIAAAERRIASANAQIGVAVAGYYPNLTLNGTYGWQGDALDQRFAPSSRIWSVGASVAQTIFDAGSRHAQVDVARAAYDQSVANYRQTVLIAFEQVEDNLAQLRILEQEADVQASAVQSAELAQRLILNQYLAGTVDYTTVVTAQAAALSNEQTALTITQNRLTASVALVQALGGGWDASQIPPHGAEREVDIAPTEDARPTWVRWVSKVLPWW
ncbi:MAG: efflux transporter outer membrane subunit [Alphaproteobacteria bacterium]|nr:efflux transporter outer membrane subunit [Alphaproteobacteria bacterium]